MYIVYYVLSCVFYIIQCIQRILYITYRIILFQPPKHANVCCVSPRLWYFVVAARAKTIFSCTKVPCICHPPCTCCAGAYAPSSHQTPLTKPKFSDKIIRTQDGRAASRGPPGHGPCGPQAAGPRSCRLSKAQSSRRVTRPCPPLCSHQEARLARERLSIEAHVLSVMGPVIDSELHLREVPKVF